MADGFPAFDPTIPMGIRVPEAQSSVNTALGQVGAIADIQNKLNEAQLFRMTLQARQKAGQIMNGAPSLEEGIATLTSDPMTAAFVPELASTMQSIRQSMIETEGSMQAQAITGLDAVIKGVFPALQDPTTFGPSVGAWMQTLSPEARDRVGKALPSLTAAFVDGLPENPEEAAAVYQQRLSASLMAAGIGPETIRAATGTMVPQVVAMPGAAGQTETRVVGGPVTGGSNALGGQLLAVGPTTTESAEMGAVGSTAGGIANDMNADSQTIPTALNSINTMQKALGEFQAGGGADIRKSIGKALQGLKNIGMEGITQEMIDGVASGSLSSQQIFEANIKPFVTNQLKMAVQGTGNVMRPEVDAFINMADATTDPTALLSILNKAKFALRVGYDRSQKWLDFKKGIKAQKGEFEGLEISDFYPWYASQYSEEDLPSQTRAGESFEDIRPEEIKGTPEAAAEGGKKERPPIGSFFSP